MGTDGNVNGSTPLPLDQYEAVKARYPRITFDDTDQSFISAKGSKAYARRLQHIRPFTQEEQERGTAATSNKVRNAYATYLKYIEKGWRVGQAATKVGLTYNAIKMKRRNDPNFAEAELMAEMQASEPIEDALYEAARTGNVPAAIKWLEKRSPDRWPGDKQHVVVENQLELSPSDYIGNIQALVARLEERRALTDGVIDVESEEPNPTDPVDG